MSDRSARPSPRMAISFFAALALAGAAGPFACGGAQTPVSKASPGGSLDPAKWPSDDRSLCDWKKNPDLEVSETAGPGALRPNVRRVYRTYGEGELHHKSLVCREVDTNLDGIKDVVRTFNAKGEALREESDTDYDGRIDTWISFVGGRIAEVQEDGNRDGRADVWKYYSDGQLSRVKRDRNYDGRPDIWEIYAHGRLERMGEDETFDGHVDRWERDDQLRVQAEAEEQTSRQALGGAGDAGSPAAASADAGGAASVGTMRAGDAAAATKGPAVTAPVATSKK